MPVQLIFNFFWSIWFYFNLGWYLFTLLWLCSVPVDTGILATIRAFAKISKPAAWLMLPFFFIHSLSFLGARFLTGKSRSCNFVPIHHL